jgi:hypothetical protein
MTNLAAFAEPPTAACVPEFFPSLSRFRVKLFPGLRLNQ